MKWGNRAVGVEGGVSWAHELRLGVGRVEVRDEEAVVVDQGLRGGALDFGEADKGGRGRVRLVGDLDEMRVSE